MTSAHVLDRQSSAPDRRPAPASVALSRMAAQPVTAARTLQSRLGNRGVLAMMAQETALTPISVHSAPAAPAASLLRVSSPTDPAEREATATASAVMRMTAPAPVGSVAGGVQRAAEVGGGGGMAPPAVSAGIGSAMSGGAPLASGVRNFMEPRFGADFGRVRVHTGQQAADLSHQLGAKAFTVGGHVFFGQNQYQPHRADGRELIAHELTHTLQQGGAAMRTIHREGDDGGGLFASLTPDGLARMAVHNIAPALEPLFAGGGLTGWLEARATSAFANVVEVLMAPAHAASGVGQELAATFGPIVATLQTAAGQIAKNDCSPLREAADKIEKTATRLITPVIEKLQPVVAAIKGFLDAVWEKIGSPIWEWIKQYAAAQWQAIKDIADLVGRAAKWLWDKTSSIRAVYAAAWKWLKDKLGIGEGPEGQDGVLQWVQAKLGAIWDGIKAKLAPFTNQLKAIGMAVGGVLLALSPAGPILAVAGAVAAAMPGLRWLYANWGKGNIIATARIYIEKTLIPPLMNAAQRLGAAITSVAKSISGALDRFAASLAAAVGSLGGSLLSFAVSAVQWLAQQVNALAAWANTQLAQAGVWLHSALDGLQSFMGKVLRFLGRVADVVIDIWGLPVLLGEEVWDAIPGCIRDPIVDFLGPIILSQIEIFQELVKDDVAWARTKADVGKIIKLVFHDHDLMGAVRATFFLILRVFNLPPDMLVTVARKAMAAWDVVSKKPLDFIKNTVRSIGVGFKLLWADKIENLKLGIQGWLLGEIKDKNILVPTDWTSPAQLFDFVTSVLGISAEHIYELLKQKFPDAPIDKIRAVFGKIASVVAWVNKAIDTTKSPAENARNMVDQAKEFGKTIVTGLAQWVAGKVAEEIGIMVAAAAASAGLSEILDIARRIYRAILTAQRWANRILMMVNDALDNVLDIAGGNVEKVGVTFLKLMQRAMPVVVGFLADQLGLGGVGAAIRGVVDKLRAEVDKAILALLGKIQAGLQALFNLLKAGVKAVLDWWHERRDFKGADGKPHAVYFQGSESSVEVIVASKPTPVETYLGDLLADPAMKDLHAQAQTALTLYRTRIKPYLKKGTTADTQRAQELPKHLTELSDLLRKLVGVNDADLPAQDTPDFQAPTYSKMFKISTKTVARGPDASGSSPEMDLMTLYASKNKSGATSWVRMHMITAQVGGIATNKNWVPAPSGVNTGTAVRAFETNIESLVRKENPNTKKPNVIWVHVWSSGFHTAPIEPAPMPSHAPYRFPREVQFSAGLYYPRAAGDWVQDPKPVLSSTATIPAPQDDISGVAPDLNSATVGQIATAAKVSDWFASEIVMHREKSGKYKNYQDIEDRMVDERDRHTAKFEEFLVRLETAIDNQNVRIVK